MDHLQFILVCGAPLVLFAVAWRLSTRRRRKAATATASGREVLHISPDDAVTTFFDKTVLMKKPPAFLEVKPSHMSGSAVEEPPKRESSL